MEAPIPHVITPQDAANALGLTVVELARKIDNAVQTRIRDMAHAIGGFSITTLDEFDEQVEGVRRQFEALIACWAIVDAEGGSEDEDE